MRHSTTRLFFAVWLLVAIGCAGAPPRGRSAASMVARGDGDTLHGLAEALARQGDLVRAEQYAMLAVQRGMPLEQALPLLVDVCVRASRISAALHHAEPVLRAAPHNHRLRFVVASLYLALSRPDDAMRELRLVLQSEPKHEGAAQLLAQIQEAL